VIKYVDSVCWMMGFWMRCVFVCSKLLLLRIWWLIYVVRIVMIVSSDVRMIRD